MPSRLRTPRPPSLPSAIAVFGETTPSIAEAISGSSSRCGPSFQPMSTSCGSRVRLDGTIAMSSNPYACRAFLPRPISISTNYLPWMHKGPGRVALAWAEKPFSLPSLKWTAIVTPSSDDSFTADRLELGHVDESDQAAGLARLEATRADLERGSRARGDRCSQRLFVRAALEPRPDEGGEQDVARADGGDRVDAGGDRAVADRLALVPQQRPATRLAGDQDVARAHFRNRLQAGEE